MLILENILHTLQNKVRRLTFLFDPGYCGPSLGRVNGHVTIADHLKTVNIRVRDEHVGKHCVMWLRNLWPFPRDATFEFVVCAGSSEDHTTAMPI